jgi:hypothetical protein
MRTHHDAKAMAKAMRERLAEKAVEISHSEALEIVARQFGFDTWNILSARIEAERSAAASPAPERAIPILRIFDIPKAHEFYLGFLGMTVDWEHRFAPHMPLYTQVSRGDLILHLSEHSGDASPGATSVVYIKNIVALHKELMGKNYRFNRPGLEKADWGHEVEVIDPFGNRLRFIERNG